MNTLTLLKQINILLWSGSVNLKIAFDGVVGSKQYSFIALTNFQLLKIIFTRVFSSREAKRK